MKRFSFIAFVLAAMVQLSQGQPASVFDNEGTIASPPSVPPQIDATNFINNGQFNITFNNINSAVNTGLVGGIIFSTQISPFEFSDVQNYTNRGTMTCDTGFIFNDLPSTSGFAQMSASFGNANLGYISAGSATNSIFSTLVFFAGPGLSFLTGVPIIQISASNIVNTGTLDLGADGFLTVYGMGVNLSRGTLHVEGFDDAAIVQTVPNIGISDNYWGIGNQSNLLSLANVELQPPFEPTSPPSQVTTSAFAATLAEVTPPNASAFPNFIPVNVSNDFNQVVFINTNLPGISTDVRFVTVQNNLTYPVIHWQAIITNRFGGGVQTITTNDLYLSDVFGVANTNHLVTNSFSFSGVPQPSPFNYTFTRSFPFYSSLSTANNNPYNAQTIFTNAFPETNAYTAYGVTLAPVSSFPDALLPGSTVTNSPGRIEIGAGTSLNLTGARITGPNYLSLISTNHFVGSAGATIVSPFMDINLGTTNGLLAITNLVAPTIARFSGPITMYSALWTNISSIGFTNVYSVLMVDADIAPTSLPLVLNAQLRSTNVIISDNLNIENSLLVNATALTITSNAAAAVNPFGELNFLSSDIVWSSSFPTLQSLTNFGYISSSNTTYFFPASQLPYYPTNMGLFSSFVNHGIISTSGDTIGASYVENTGVGTIFTNIGFSNNALIFSSIGPVTIQASNALLANASIVAASGDITISADNLTISNHPLQASGALTFSVSNSLADGGAASSNFWFAGDGISLLVKPLTGGFPDTTVTLTAPPELEVDNIWAGLDKGPVASGFVNNGAMGRLILSGGDNNSQFFFGGPDETNHYAIYVDQLELTNGATNRASEGGTEVFTAFDVAPNFTIYFADATEGGFDISEKLNGANGGALIWVPSYAGIFSSTNLVYPAGVTNTFNRALVESTDIDSNGNGIANAFDPEPIYTSSEVNLTLSLTNLPPEAPVLKWSTLANSTNIVLFKTSVTSTNWMVLTNFVQGPANGTATFIDRGRTNSAAFYKVQVNAEQP